MRLIVDLQGAQSFSRNRGIGRYTRSLVQAMAQQARGHEIILVLNNGFPDAAEEIRHAFAGILPPDAIRLWQGPGQHSATSQDSAGRRLAAEHIRASVLQSMRADLVLVCSLFEGFGDDAVTALPPGAAMPPIVGICYDLIPLLRPDQYLTSEIARNWYFRRLLQMRHMAGLMAISASSRSEALDQLGLPGDRVANIQAGVAPYFRPARPEDESTAALLARYSLPAGAILCIGAVEPRKNLDGLIRAYALLPPALRRAHRLVATGWNDIGQLHSLHALAASCGLGPDEVTLLTEFVAEHDLPGLYRASALSISPSLHEGFGLSAAEAMACGVPVIGSNTTSLPEVIGTPAALFDPADPAAMAERMEAVLTDPALRRSLVEAGLARSAQFTWPQTAERAWTALETFHEQMRRDGRQPVRPGDIRPRLGVISPLLRDHAIPTAVLCGLAAHYRVDLVSEDPPPAGDPWMMANFSVLSTASLGSTRFDRLLYYPADDARAMMLTLKLLDSYPGVVALGKRPLAALLSEVLGSEGASALQDTLIELHGWRAAILARDEPRELARDNHGRVAGHTLDEALSRRAVGLIVAGQPQPFQAELANLQIVENDDPAAWQAAIERSYAAGELAGYDSCLSSLAEAGLPAAILPSAAAAASASFRPQVRARCLFLDVSTTASFDAGTGIQRVVREITRELGQLDTLGSGCKLDARIEPVRDTGSALLLARAFGARLFGLPAPDEHHQLAEIGQGDIFIGLDLNMHDVGGLERTLRQVRSAGGRAMVVIYDLLPTLLPQFFPEPVQKMFPVWLDLITHQADAALCISRTVADELRARLALQPPSRRKPLHIGWFHLGSDFRPAAKADAATALVTSEACVVAEARTRPTVLMVGTVEPRKGHTLALEAFEALWSRNVDIALTIVGKAGWMMEPLADRMRSHPQIGIRLNWVEHGSDALVSELYRSAGALLMASEGEGFGLPIVEAAQAGLAIITRDLPVFREVANEHALYFPASGPADGLAATLQQWLALRASGDVPDSTQIRTLSWRESAAELAKLVLLDKWYTTWEPPAVFRDDRP